MPRGERAKSRSLVKACTECQRRKSRCSGVAPCSFCAKTGRKCVFDAPPERTSLTRKNLDESEARCKRLEALLKTLNPEVDVDSLLDKEQLQAHDRQRPSTSPVVGGPSNADEIGLAFHPGEQSGNITPLTEYEWHESPPSNKHATSQHGGSDEGAGMGLESKPFKSGYLGSGSGSSLLEAISAFLPFAGADDLKDSPRLSTSQPSPAMRPPIYEKLLAEANIATIVLTTRLIDAYFVFYNTSYPILHKRTFQASCENRDSIPSRSSWHLIFYAVLAIGHWVLSSGDGSDHSPYYAAARSRLSMRMLESGTLGGVQAFLLMGNYLQKRDRPNTGYNLIGIAYRMALGLGIHRELPQRLAREESLSTERRRQVWWVLYCFDSGFSITTGRPTTASDAFIDARLPRNIEDIDIDPGDKLPPEVDYPTTYSAIIAQANLAMIANKIYNNTLSASVRHDQVEDQVAMELENQLAMWRASLPSYFYSSEVPLWFRGPRAVVLWKEQNLRLMLWHGGQRQHNLWHDKINAADKCQLAAIEVINDIATFCKEHVSILHMGLSWYATYFLFQAVLVLNVRLLKSTEHTVNESMSTIWSTSVAQARNCLSDLGLKNSAAKRCVAVLDRVQSHLEVAMSRKAAGNPFSLSPVLGGFAIETTPEALITDNDNWLSAADPGLQFFLGDATMTNLFEGLEGGFPNTHEEQYFGYVPGNIYNVQGSRGASDYPDQYLSST